MRKPKQRNNITIPEEYKPDRGDSTLWQKYRNIRNIEIRLVKGYKDNMGDLYARMLQEVIDCAFFNPMDLFDSDGNMRAVNDIPGHAGIAISGMEVAVKRGADGEQHIVRKLKLIDKAKYLYLLGRMMKLWNTDPGENGDVLDEIEQRYRDEQRRIADDAIRRLQAATSRQRQQEDTAE